MPLVNGFSIDVKVSDLQKIQDLKGVASVKPVRVYYPADSSAKLSHEQEEKQEAENTEEETKSEL